MPHSCPIKGRRNFCVMTDASDVAVGAALQQMVDNTWQPIAFFPKSLQPAASRYSTLGREHFSVYLSLPHFRNFLEGRNFFVLIDHKPLTYVFLVTFSFFLLTAL